MGRPRSESTRRAILESAAELVAEIGYEKVTVEAIASRAGAGKQTIYRWWSSKSIVIADAVIEGYLRLPAVDVGHTGSLEHDLKAWVREIDLTLGDPTAVSIVRALATAASDDDDDARKLWDQITGPLHRALITRLQQGQAVGQLATTVDASAIADALIGTVLFRTLTRQPASEKAIDIVDVLLASSPRSRE